VKKNNFNLILVFSSIIMWSFSFPLIKIVLDNGVPPITLSALRTLSFIPILLYLILKNRKNILPNSKNEWFMLSGISIFTIIIPNVLQNIGMMNTTASVTSIIQSSGPIFTILMAIILLKESTDFNKISGAIVALIATILLTITNNGKITLEGITVFSNSLILLSSISYSFSSIITKKGLNTIKPLKMLGLSSFIGFIILSFTSLIERPIVALSNLSIETWFIVLLLIMFPSFIALIFWYEVMIHEEISRLVIFVYLLPVFSVIFSILLLGETITIQTIIFSSIIIGGIAFSQKEFKKLNQNVGGKII